MPKPQADPLAKVKVLLHTEADAIQKLATLHHKIFLGGKKYRSEMIKKYQVNHIKVVKALAENLDRDNLKKGMGVFKKLGKDLASDSVRDGLYIEEAVDGTIFLKQAVWQMLDERGVLDELTTRMFYQVSQSVGTYCDIVASEIAFAYHNEYIQKITQEREKREEDSSRLAAIITSSDDAIISKTLDGIITSWNKSAEVIFGYTAAEAVGKHITLIIPPDLRDQENVIISKIKKGERIEHFDTVRLRKDGKRISISLTVSPIKNSAGTIIGASKIARDISERKALETQKEDFLSIASHELKTPVTSLKAYAQVLQYRFRKAQDVQSAELVGKMDAQLNKLTALIADLLDSTKIEGGRLQFNEGFFDFNELVNEVVEELQRTTERHELQLKLSSTRTIYGDRERIGQVIVNFITNAIKYSPRADKIIIKTKIDKGNVTLSVQDFGIGIPKDEQAKVFERFFRVGEKGQETRSSSTKK